MKKTKLSIFIVLVVSVMLLLSTINAAGLVFPSLDFETCDPIIASFSDTARYVAPTEGSTLYYQIVGLSQSGCIMLYSSDTTQDQELEDVNFDIMCAVPQEIGSIPMSVDLSEIEEYCVPVPGR